MAAGDEPPDASDGRGAAQLAPGQPGQPTAQDLAEARKLIGECRAEARGQRVKLTTTEEKVDKTIAAAGGGATLAGAYLAVAATDPMGIVLSGIGLLGLGWSGYRWIRRKLDARRDRRIGERNNAKLKRALELLGNDEPWED